MREPIPVRFGRDGRCPRVTARSSRPSPPSARPERGCPRSPGGARVTAPPRHRRPPAPYVGHGAVPRRPVPSPGRGEPPPPFRVTLRRLVLPPRRSRRRTGRRAGASRTGPSGPARGVVSTSRRTASDSGCPASRTGPVACRDSSETIRRRCAESSFGAPGSVTARALRGGRPGEGNRGACPVREGGRAGGTGLVVLVTGAVVPARAGSAGAGSLPGW